MDEELLNIISHMGTHAYKAGITDDTKAQYLKALSFCTNIQAWEKVKDNYIEGAPPYKGMPTIKQLRAMYYNYAPKDTGDRTGCVYCNGFGLLTALKVDGKEYQVCCNCRNGEETFRRGAGKYSRYEPEKHSLKYPFDMELTEKETKIFNWVKKFGVEKAVKAVG